jgi:hypothetical protein
MLFRVHRYHLCCLLAMLLALASGCGVQEYEKKMLESQMRFQRWEEDARVLTGGYISVPSVKEGESEYPIANIFLRMPKNIRTSPEAEPTGPTKNLWVYTEATPGAVAKVGLAAGDKDSFRDDVVRNFPTDGKPNWRQTSLRALGRENSTTFDTTEVRDGDSLISINISNGKPKVAIVYWVRQNQRDAGLKLVNSSLQTFAAGKEATKQRERHGKGSPAEQPPPAIRPPDEDQ